MVAGVEGSHVEMLGGKRKKKRGGNRSHRATVQAPAKTARVEKEGRGAGGGGRKTLVKLSTDA